MDTTFWMKKLRFKETILCCAYEFKALSKIVTTISRYLLKASGDIKLYFAFYFEAYEDDTLCKSDQYHSTYFK